MKRRASKNVLPSSKRQKLLLDRRYEQSLNAEQYKIFERCFLAGVNLFITGQAGTGKTHLIKQIKHCAEALEKSIEVTASTGCAAVNLEGTTFHHFCGINLGERDSKHYVKNMKPENRQRIKWCDVLIVDEISMLDVNFLIKCDEVIKEIRKDAKPFGGIQLILVGDFLQLPPVITGKAKELYVPLFMHSFWKTLNLEYHFLKTNHRQKEDSEFAELLSNIRMGKLNENDFNNLIQRTELNDIPPHTPRLFCKKTEVQQFNKKELAKLSGEVVTINAGGFNMDKITHHVPVERELNLKVGAQVILCRNVNVEEGLFNGKRGKVVGFSDDSLPLVEFSKEQTVKISKFKWEMKENAGKGKVLASFIQVPLILAWAVTVHKTQGMTLESAVVHGGFFDPGHAYVAFSRVKTIEGLHLEGVSFSEIKTDERVVKFYEEANETLRG